MFRHTAATLMLHNGADLRSLQLYLGHKRLDTTQIYTHVSIRELKAVHDRTHPARADGSALPDQDQTLPDQGSSDRALSNGAATNQAPDGRWSDRASPERR